MNISTSAVSRDDPVSAPPHLYALTSSQREIWFDQAIQGRSSMYNIGGYIHIAGAVDPERFERAVSLLARKHDCLRTVLVRGESAGDVPSQTFLGEMPLRVPVREFSQHADPHAAALEGMQARLDEPFDVYGGPLLHFELLKINPGCWYWLIKMHHLIVDGWSIALLCRSLGEIYTALDGGVQPDLTAHSYVSFIEDDREYVGGSTFQRHRRYWLERYQNLPEPLVRARYRGAGRHEVVRSERRSVALARPFYDRLIAFAKGNDSTTFQVILAALYVYCLRSWGRSELVVGLPVLNRANAAHKATAGLFVGVSAVRFNFGTELTCKELLRCIARVLRQEYRYQRFPVSELNREQALQGSDHHQIYDVQLSYERHDYVTMFGSAPGHGRALLNSYQAAPLTVFVREFYDDEDVDLDFVYNLAYFQSWEIDAIQKRFINILDWLMRDVTVQVESVPLHAGTELSQLVLWFVTGLPYSQRCVDELYEAQVVRTPDALAMEHGERRVSYAQLNRAADRLAHYLQSQDDKTKTQVALDLERSVELVCAQRAILKCKAGYVPLDQDAPLERKAFILEDCSAGWVVTLRAHVLPAVGSHRIDLDVIDLVGAERHGRVLDAVGLGGVDAEATDLNGAVGMDLSAGARETEGARGTEQDVVDLKGAADGADLKEPEPGRLAGASNEEPAYVMYTSGSTGQPKGVEIAHRGIVRLVMNNGYAQFTDSDRVAFAANPAFDASTMEVWGALLNGGCAVVIDRATVLQPRRLQQCLLRQLISILFLSSGLFNQMARVLPQAFASLRYLIVGGESLDPQVFAQVLRAGRPQHFLHAYGPTETTTFATTYEIEQVDEQTRTVPIGKPIGNTRFYVLVGRGRPVPIGVEGEIYIGGAGVGRGYLNRPELTAERFVRDPFVSEAGARMYRTGDLGRYLPDGNIEFLGRYDQQVKLRGYRIELGEIEARLQQQPGIGAAVVLAWDASQEPRSDGESAAPARPDVSGDKRLVAYYTLDENAAKDGESAVPDAASLRAQLAASLPEYKVPAAYERLAALPLTP